MYNKQLDTFLKVAEKGSFSAAAAELFISTSAVIQQINILEKNLKVTLFKRTRRGISLTEAGHYLAVQALEYIDRGEQIRQQLLLMENKSRFICVGTSMEEKCRLLYDLWVLFSRSENAYDIRLVTMDAQRHIPKDVELIESVSYHARWQQGWKFMEICQVPLGCAIARDHPLAGCTNITVEQLRGREMLVLDPEILYGEHDFYTQLEEAGIHLIYCREFSGSQIWECSLRHRAILAPLVWDDILFDMTVHPCEWNLALPYGFFYKPQPSEPLEHFLSFVKDVYTTGGKENIIPVL